MMKNKLLIINGSPNGKTGQSGTIASAIEKTYAEAFEFKHLILALDQNIDEWKKLLSWAEGFIFLSGTYWDSWGSPLQVFLEKTTQWETSPLWLGKPAATIITMHSVGGKSVLSRLQGVLNTLGLSIPPLGGLVYSLNSHLLKDTSHTHVDDFWQLEETEVLVQNLSLALKSNQKNWATWPVDRQDVTRAWLNHQDIKVSSTDRAPL